MASKDKTQSIVTLTEQAAAKLAAILSAPSTPKQKQSFEKSVGVYSLYQKKWQKKVQ